MFWFVFSRVLAIASCFDGGARPTIGNRDVDLDARAVTSQPNSGYLAEVWVTLMTPNLWPLVGENRPRVARLATSIIGDIVRWPFSRFIIKLRLGGLASVVYAGTWKCTW